MLSALIGAIGIIAIGSMLDVFSYKTALTIIEREVPLILIWTLIVVTVAEEFNKFEFVAIKFPKIGERHSPGSN